MPVTHEGGQKCCIDKRGKHPMIEIIGKWWTALAICRQIMASMGPLRVGLAKTKQLATTNSVSVQNLSEVLQNMHQVSERPQDGKYAVVNVVERGRRIAHARKYRGTVGQDHSNKCRKARIRA